VCWRLAAQLAGRGQPVRLWVDDPSGLAWMAPHGAAGVTVRRWCRAGQGEVPGQGADDDPGAAVIEAFGCDLPEPFLARMAAQLTAPVWINLEYLSAEAYVERSHRLTSPQWHGPAAGLTKWFWYPGFTPRTGGLLRDGAAEAQLGSSDGPGPGSRLASALWARATGGRLAPPPPADRLALLFCYDHPATPGCLEAMTHADAPWWLLVTPGQSRAAAERWWRGRTGASEALGEPLFIDDQPRRCGHLTLVPLQHLAQPDFDALLGACDLNIVRGEDSFVRAHWAGRPFIWQIYVQDDGAQHEKLAAWLDRWTEGAPDDLARLIGPGHAAWNGLPLPAEEGPAVQQDQAQHQVGRIRLSQADQQAWPQWLAPSALDGLGAWGRQRARQWAGQPDLASQLLHFVAEQGA
jgi:uncharacterized repeat protein (TIGR03837 family)